MSSFAPSELPDLAASARPVSALTRLSVSRFRSHDAARMDDLHTGAVVLTSPNGAGKTNLLEAVSMLAPGRGLRAGRMIEMQGRAHKDAPRMGRRGRYSGAIRPAQAGLGVGRGGRPAHIPDQRCPGADTGASG